MHAQAGVYVNVIGAGVHIYIYLWLNRTLSDQLTFSNIRSRISRQIYRLALQLRAPETLSSLSKIKDFHA